MHQQPHSPETISTPNVQPQFTPGTERQVIDNETQGLNADELISYWRTFQPSLELPYPSAFSPRHAVDDIAAVLSGAKPSTLFEIHPADFEKSLFLELLERAHMQEDLAVTQVGGFNINGICIIAPPNAARLLVDQYNRVVFSGLRPDAEFHQTVGSTLGYPQAAIDDFLSRTLTVSPNQA